MSDEIATLGIKNIKVLLNEALFEDAERSNSCPAELLRKEEEEVFQQVLDLFQRKYGRKMYSKRDMIVRLVPPSGETSSSAP